MHVTRPKSSKGRSRPALNHTKSADISAYRECPVTPGPVRAGCPLRPARPRPRLPEAEQRRYRPGGHRAPAGGPGPAHPQPQQFPARPPGAAALKVPRLSEQPGDGRGARSRGPEAARPRCEAECEAAEAEGLGTAPSADQLGLLLAVRSPCGRRLQRRFLPTDTLRAVLAAAEDAHGARYGRAVVQTVEVPRRSFADLNVTLAQCGIQNRSVLCISKEDDGSADST
ncbi:hypothetical protein ANANG_G00220170 [Anguilla anguilla]|uniref:UBX domain-containing protein n=1 Tax=Anguilla anguilla TaxID=7936 RepID=A0A9D3LW08_ANGAN|nr:hypothetical protein ANANG_G00220170 [Anguilla anguilla]